jgi:general secretion pathway protein M
MKLDWRQLSGFTQRLSARERTILGVGGAAMVVIGLYSLVWEPLAEGRVRLAQRIAGKQRQLEEIQGMRETYMGLLRQLEASQQVLDRADPKFSLFPHIEATVAQVVGRDKIKSMNPENKEIGGAYREDSVELKLAGISLDQLVDMMYRIEKGAHPLRITRLQVKKQLRDPHMFDVTATVSMLKPIEGA